MILDKSITEILKEELLTKLGNPKYYYNIWCGEDGFYIEEVEIKNVELEQRYSGGPVLKLNGEYVGDRDYLFNKELAQKRLREMNLEYWKSSKESAERELSTIDAETIKRKAKLKAKIEIAEMNLKLLESDNERVEE